MILTSPSELILLSEGIIGLDSSIEDVIKAYGSGSTSSGKSPRIKPLESPTGLKEQPFGDKSTFIIFKIKYVILFLIKAIEEIEGSYEVKYLQWES